MPQYVICWARVGKPPTTATLTPQPWPERWTALLPVLYWWTGLCWHPDIHEARTYASREEAARAQAAAIQNHRHVSIVPLLAQEVTS